MNFGISYQIIMIMLEKYQIMKVTISMMNFLAVSYGKGEGDIIWIV